MSEYARDWQATVWESDAANGNDAALVAALDSGRIGAAATMGNKSIELHLRSLLSPGSMRIISVLPHRKVAALPDLSSPLSVDLATAKEAGRGRFVATPWESAAVSQPVLGALFRLRRGGGCIQFRVKESLHVFVFPKSPSERAKRPRVFFVRLDGSGAADVSANEPDSVPSATMSVRIFGTPTFVRSAACALTPPRARSSVLAPPSPVGPPRVF